MKRYKPWYKKVLETTKKIKFRNPLLYLKTAAFSAATVLSLSAIVIGATRLNSDNTSVDSSLTGGTDVTFQVNLPENPENDQEIDFNRAINLTTIATRNYLNYLRATSVNPLIPFGANIVNSSIRSGDNTITFTISNVTAANINRFERTDSEAASFSSQFQPSIFNFGNAEGSFYTPSGLATNSNSDFFNSSIITPGSFTGTLNPTSAENPDVSTGATVNFSISDSEAWNQIISTANENADNPNIALFYSRITDLDTTNVLQFANQNPPTIPNISDDDFNDSGNFTNLDRLTGLTLPQNNNPILLGLNRAPESAEGTDVSFIVNVDNVGGGAILNQVVNSLNAATITDPIQLVSVVDAPVIFTDNGQLGFIIGGSILLALVILFLLLRYSVLGLLGTVLLGVFSVSTFLIANPLITSLITNTSGQYNLVGLFAYLFMFVFLISRLFIFLEKIRKEYIQTNDFQKSVELVLKKNVWRSIDIHVILFIFAVVFFFFTQNVATVQEFVVVLFSGIISSFGILFILLPLFMWSIANNKFVIKSIQYWNWDLKKKFTNKIKNSLGKKFAFTKKFSLIASKNLWWMITVPVIAIITLITSLTAGTNTQADFRSGTQFVVYDDENSILFIDETGGNTGNFSLGFLGQFTINDVSNVINANSDSRVLNTRLGYAYINPLSPSTNTAIDSLSRRALIISTNLDQSNSGENSFNFSEAIREALADDINLNNGGEGGTNFIVSEETTILPGNGIADSLVLLAGFGIFLGFLVIYMIARFRKSQLLTVALSLAGGIGLLISLVVLFQVPLTALVLIGFLLFLLSILVVQFTLFATFREKLKLLKQSNKALTKVNIREAINNTYKENWGWMFKYSLLTILLMIFIAIPLGVVNPIISVVIIGIVVAVILPIIWGLPLLLFLESFWSYKTNQLNINVEKKGRKVDEHIFKGINS